MNIKPFIYTLLYLCCPSSLFSQQTEIKYLSGTGSDNTVDWGFFCTKGMNLGKWTTIPVPSNWELQGFGGYDYGYNKVEGRADEQGLYKHYFMIPESWENRTINIVFEGSMTDTEVKVNGKSAGPVHQGAFYRFKYDITNLISFKKENLLEVSVSKISSDASVNKAERNADYWIFGGIFRPVYLEALPQNHIEQVSVNARANGKIDAIVKISDKNEADQLKMEVRDVKGEILQGPLIINVHDKLVHVSGAYENFKQWSPESPVLYTARFTLMKNGNALHTVEQKIGFRTVELRVRDGIYLNGTKIKFKGVNRHSFYPSTGRTLSKARSIEDVMLVKEMNMNAIRNSHYPADIHFYEACDSLGVMVLDELGGWHDAYDTRVGSKLVKEMMYKSMNHPCVVMWVNGNEGGHNYDLLPLYDSIDLQKRPVIHAWHTFFNNMNTQHYRDYNYGNGVAFQGHDVVFPTEFLHGLYDGGHGAGLEDFWGLMWDTPLAAGGFLWDFADEAVVRTDKNGILDSDGNHGADGILGPYHEKEGSFYTIKEVWAPIFFEKREITPSFDGKLRIENRYHFTNTNQCRFTWELRKITTPFHSAYEENIEGTAISPNIIPGAKDTLVLNLPEDFTGYDFLYVSAFDPFNKEIFTWSWPVSLPSKIAENVVSYRGNGKIKAKDKDTVLTVSVNDISLEFSKNTGMIAGVKNQKGGISLSNGPVLYEGQGDFKDISFTGYQDSLIVSVSFNENSFNKEVLWTIYPSGWVKLYVEYCPEKERHDLLGISFSYPEEYVKSIEWMGEGPYRVWKNRMKGNQLGYWQKDYNNTITGQTEYIYPEFKGYHSRMYWLSIVSEEQDFTVVTPDEDIFFRMYTPGTPDDPYNTAPLFPSGDISFLHGITPIGTKPLQTYRMGPMSEKNIYYTYGGVRCKKMTLFFDFTGKNAQ